MSYQERPSYRIPDAFVAEANAKLAAAQDENYHALGMRLARASVDIERVTATVAAFAVADDAVVHAQFVGRVEAVAAEI